MDGVCESLQNDDRWKARVLASAANDCVWKATAFKIIELRNVLEKPLLVFVPPGLRTAAEDSLDIATFTELSLIALARDLAGALIERLPDALRTRVEGVLGHLRQERRIRNTDEEVTYLLTLLKNGASPEAAGGALFIFGLIPDFRLFSRGEELYWLSRNIKACELLASGQPLQTSVLQLPVKANTIQPALFGFLRGRHRGNVRLWGQDIATRSEHRGLAMDRWDFSDAGAATDDLRLIMEPLSLHDRPRTS